MSWTQDDHLAAAILNEVYDSGVDERIEVLAAWIKKIREDDRRARDNDAKAIR